MSLYPITYGCLITLGTIMPLGAQNVFIFNQGSQQLRFIHTWPSIITASICDGILIYCAMMGLTLAVLKVAWLKTIILTMGLIFLCYLSYSLWTRADAVIAQGKPASWLKQITYSLSVTLLNPHALIDTIFIVGSIGLIFTNNQDKILFGISCIITELLWFSLVSFTGNCFRRLPNSNKVIFYLNRTAALMILFIAISMLFNF